jgi:GMP synthase-like glutamine amidotransferase
MTPPLLSPPARCWCKAIDGGLPVLGVCLGAELLCQATGGAVHELDAPAIGWQTLERGADADDDPIFGDVENWPAPAGVALVRP